MAEVPPANVPPASIPPAPVAPPKPTVPVAAPTKASPAQAAVEAADAVAKAATAAAEAARIAAANAPKVIGKAALVASGVAGGKVTIMGAGFRTSGTVKLNGAQVKTTSWSNARIEGELPADAKSGTLEVHVDDETVLTGPLSVGEAVSQ